MHYPSDKEINGYFEVQNGRKPENGDQFLKCYTSERHNFKIQYQRVYFDFGTWRDIN